MKLDAGRLAIATAIVTAVLWLACSALVSLAPVVTMALTEAMVHADLSAVAWSLSWSAVLVGLVAWTVSTALAGFLLAWRYNRLSRAPSAEWTPSAPRALTRMELEERTYGPRSRHTGKSGSSPATRRTTRRMVADFRRHFWGVALNAPVLALAPLIQSFLGVGDAWRFEGDYHVQFSFASGILFCSGSPVKDKPKMRMSRPTPTTQLN